MFTPKGEKPLWKMVYEYIVPMQIGDVVTYEDLSKVVDQDVTINRSLIYTANKHLLRDHKRLLVVERGIGYKIVEGMDIMYHASDRQIMAKKQVGLANFETTHINTLKLTPDDKDRLQKFMAGNANIRAAFVQKIDRLEKANQITELAVGVTKDDLQALREWVEERKTK